MADKKVPPKRRRRRRGQTTPMHVARAFEPAWEVVLALLSEPDVVALVQGAASRMLAEPGQSLNRTPGFLAATGEVCRLVRGDPRGSELSDEAVIWAVAQAVAMTAADRLLRAREKLADDAELPGYVLAERLRVARAIAAARPVYWPVAPELRAVVERWQADPASVSGRGRLPGDGRMPPEEFHRQLEAALALRGRSLTLERLAGFLGMEWRTLRAYLTDPAYTPPSPMLQRYPSLAACMARGWKRPT